MGRRKTTRETTVPQPKPAAVTHTITRTTRQNRRNGEDYDVARQAHGTIWNSASQAGVGMADKEGSGDSIRINNPSPIPSTQVTETLPTGSQNPSDFASSIEIGSLVRKRKLEQLRAAEAIAKIEAEEETRAIEFEKRIFELEQKRLQREKALMTSRMELDELEHDAEIFIIPTPAPQPEASAAPKRVRQNPTTALNFQQQNINNSNQIQNQNAFEQLAEAFSQAFQRSMSTGNAEMKKFVARQAHSRDLAPFYGDPDDWPSFISEFRASNAECQYTNIENMTRLKNCLKGNAREAVKSMLIIPDNVEQVIHTLEINFGRPDLIISTLIEKVSKLPRASEDSPDSLLQLSNAVLNLVSTMQLLDETGHLLNPQLLHDLEGKLPTFSRVQWAQARMQSKGKITLLEFSSWLQDFSTAMSRVGGMKNAHFKEDSSQDKDKSSSRQNNHSGNNRESRHRETVMSIVADPDEISTNCTLCQSSNHSLERCPEFQRKSLDSRWNFVRKNNICFCCLKKGHQVKNCFKKRGKDKDRVKCGIDGCQMPHNRILHRLASTTETTTTETVGFVSSGDRKKKNILLKVIPVKLRGPLGEISTHAFLDDGSTATLLDREIAAKIGASGPAQTLKLRWTNNEQQQVLRAERVTIFIIGLDGKSHKLEEVKAIDGMNLPMQFVDVDSLRKRWKYLQRVNSCQMEQGQPKILIGQAHWDLIQTVDVIRGPSHGPALSKTKLGWVLHGVVPHPQDKYDEVYTMAHWDMENDNELHNLVKTSFSTEDFGVKVVSKLPRSKDDTRAQLVMDKTTRKVGGRWETGILWREENPQLPESWSMAMRSLISIEKKMDKDPSFALQYCSKIEENIQKGFAQILNPETAKIENSKTWYLPHFAVFNPNKPGKIRIVFDAARKSHGKSFNDFVVLGPDKLRPLMSVIFTFRQRAVAFGGDIKEMFPQIKIREEDRCAQRFLWRGMDRDRPPDVCEFSSMIFGASSSPYQAQEVKERNALQFQEQFPTAVKAIVENHYMDDYYDSTDTIEQGIKLIKDVLYIHNQGGFQMCNWTSNSKEILESIPQHLRANGDKDFEIVDMPSERVLGIHWNPNSDDFNFILKFNHVSEEIVKGIRRPTKREILKLVMSLFDPLGFISHFTVRAKILLQDIWRAGIGWDDEVTETIFLKWQQWVEELKKVSNLRIPRCYCLQISTNRSIQLHVFCDSSEKAFAAAAYFRIELEHGEINTALVMGKTRVTPLKPLSIPRLELQAAVMGSRLSKTILDAHDLNIECVYFWSDSISVLKWLRSDARKYNSFVAHRVGEIMETTDIKNWNWIPSSENVADDATRDGPDSNLSSGSRWFSGPDFLKSPSSAWPEEKQNLEVEGEDTELKPEFLGLITPGENPSLPDPYRFSKWSRLVRTTAWILRVFNLRKYPKRKFTANLTNTELEEAEKLWWKQIQAEYFHFELSQLKTQKPLHSSSRIITLSPYLDNDGILRVRGRTTHSKELLVETKNPVILHPDHHVTKLIINHYHCMVNHHGQNQVVNELRQKYWILSLRTAVRSSWSSCLICKIRRSKPQQPEMAPLPDVRVNRPLRPFCFSGIDFFGPLYVRNGRKVEKRYGVIFACMSTRAIHLDIAYSLTTESAIMVIQRFIELRAPEKIFSDNGRNLRGAERELRNAVNFLDHSKIYDKLMTRKIEWSFIPPGSPHMGGSWESLIKSVKTTLNHILKAQTVKEEVLRTLLAEAQGIVNGHPLTHVPVDPSDLESLTPNHFLIGASSGNAPHVYVNSSTSLHPQWQLSQKLADNFWKRWVREYLPSLTRRTKWHKTTRPIKIGDLVFVADNNLPRNHWPRGIIVATHPGKDNIIRVVDVKTNLGEYRRSLSKICILDISQG